MVRLVELRRHWLEPSWQRQRRGRSLGPVGRMVALRRPRVQRAVQVEPAARQAVVERSWRLDLLQLVGGPGTLRAGGPYQMVDGVEGLRVDNR